MKKTFKISALALAMSALLFSCADPNNTNGGANNSNTPNVAPDGNTNPDTPAEDVIKPTDVKKPAGYKPSENATAVANAETGNTVLAGVINYISLEPGIVEIIPETDTTIISDKTMIEGQDMGPTYSVTPKVYNLKDNNGTADIKKFTYTASYYLEEDFTVDIKDFPKFYGSGDSNIPIKALKQKNKVNYPNCTYSVAALFDTGTSNGILVYDLTLSETAPSFTKVEFYKLDGIESYKYKDADLKALNETLAQM